MTAKKIRDYGDSIQASASLVASVNRVLANQAKTYGLNLMVLYVRLNTLAGYVVDDLNKIAEPG
ncbi:hypothetical protein [Amycolatopsis sp. NPDC004378]